MTTKTPHLSLLPSSFKTSARRYAADRGVLTVPERRGASRTRLVRLPILRIRSPHPNPGASIVVLGGGPGLTNMKARPPDRLLASHDVVIVGYRGVDGSVKLGAPEVRRAMRGVGKDLLGPASRANFGRAIRQSAARMAEEGIDLGGYTIPEVVEDLEDARMALGYEHVNLLSESYGTRVAQVYAAAHADRVARSVMIGVNPPGRFVWEPALIDQQLRYYAELYQKASDGRQTAQNLAETMRDVVRNLPDRWGPIRLDRGKIRVVTFVMLFNRQTAALVFDAFIAAASGDFSGLALMSVASDVVVPRLFTWGDFLAKGATADYEAGRDYATDLDPADSIIGSPMSLLIFDGLADGAWPVERPASTPRSAQRSDVPSLLLSGTVDFSTPAELATRELLPSLANGKQVIVAEAGHVDDLWNLQRAATEQLLVSFFGTGIADDTGFTYVPMDFRVPMSLQLISKSAAAATAVLLVGSGFAAWRLGRRYVIDDLSNPRTTAKS